MGKRFIFQALLASLLLFSGLSWGKETSFDLGPAIFMMYGPHYRGANEERLYTIPYPAFIYKSDRIKAENAFIFGKLYQERHLTFSMSMVGSLPVGRKENKARQGMPSLLPTIEVGPMMKMDIWEKKFNETKVNLDFFFPIRTNFAVDILRAERNGFFSVPHFALSMKQGKFYSNLTAALMWGSAAYHHYFYGVSHLYATPERPSYQAQSGYSGYHFTLVQSYRINKLQLLYFARYDQLKGVAFRNSPLVKKNDYFAFGINISYFFKIL